MGGLLMTKFIKIFTLVLIVSTLLATSAFASVNSNDQGTLTYTRDLSYDEAIQVLVEKAGMSIREARAKLGSDKMTARNGSYIYRELITTQDFGEDTIVEYGLLAEIYVYNSFRNFTGVEASWAKALSSGSYTYDNSYHHQDVTPAKITDYGRGTVEVVKTYTSTKQVNAGIELFVKAGFFVSEQEGYTVYFRKTDSFTATYTLY